MSLSDGGIPKRGEAASVRGRGGGYLPKKRLQQQQTQTKPLLSASSSEKENEAIEPPAMAAAGELEDKTKTTAEQPANKSAVETPTATNGKRCDFCCEPGHMSRFCPIFSDTLQSRNAKSVAHSNKDIVCYFCHEEGHIKAECPKRRSENACFYCKEEGHHISECVKKAQRDAKDRKESALRVVNYTFRKSATSQERQGGVSNSAVVTKPYECETDSEADEQQEEGEKQQQTEEKKADQQQLQDGVVKEKPRVIVPMPVPASAVKPQVQLRSKLLSSDSEHSTLSPNASARQIAPAVRSESSEEEERSELEITSAEEDEDGDEQKKEEEKATADEQQQKEGEEGEKEEVKGEEANGDEKPKENGVGAEGEEEGELQSVQIAVDGCVEFDSDSSSYYEDCNDGGEGQLRRIPEEDEYYGEDGALLDLDNETNGGGTDGEQQQQEPSMKQEEESSST